MHHTKYTLFLAFILFTASAFANKTIVKAIKKGNTESVQKYFEAGNDVNTSVKNKYSYLYYAIKYQQVDICYLLLKSGADPNHIVKKKPPLFWALDCDSVRIARYLIEFGANVNYQDRRHRTALIYAVRDANFQLAKLLVERGADPLTKDKKDKIAIDYIDYLDDKFAIKAYLKSIHHQIKNSAPSKDYKDGPYLFWESDYEGFLTYFERLGKEKRVILSEKTIKFDGNPVWVKGFNSDDNRYYITKDFTAEKSTYNTKGQVFVIGDIHGNLDGLLTLLINNRIIDNNNNWIFGDGHFVVLGDFFDRGTKVTETLWFLRNLQQKAQLKSGEVHVLLGNHEIMTMEGDHRYLHPQYMHISQFIHIYYFGFYDELSEMGLWLRSLNAMIKINDYLFTHAGVSPGFAALNYSLDTINYTLRDYLNGKIRRVLDSKINNILKADGPFWYRGYADPWKLVPDLTNDSIDSFLSLYDVNHMVIGHNEQKKVTRTMDGKLLSIDVSMGADGKKAQALLIDNGKLYRCFANGRKELIEKDDPPIEVQEQDSYNESEGKK